MMRSRNLRTRQRASLHEILNAACIEGKTFGGQRPPLQEDIE